MLTSFNFQPVPEIVFGEKSLTRLPEKILQFGTRLLLVLGGSTFCKTREYKTLAEELNNLQIEFEIAHISGEPSPEMINNIVAAHPHPSFDLVVAIGGGSVVDAGKALAAMLIEQQDITLFLEGVGTKTPSGRKLPFIAVPTTSGTGSEATANSVITSVGSSGFKKSLRHSNYVPNLAIIDPALTLSCPPELTACCGMDCFTQLVEAYLSTKGSPLTDALCIEGIQAIERSLMSVCKDDSNIKARADLSYAALLSGIVLASAGLGTVHGFASVLGGLFPAPHGVVCGILMHPANRLTLKRLRDNSPANVALVKYSTLGEIFSKKPGQDEVWYQDHFVDTLKNYTDNLNIPTLDTFGVKEGDIERIVALTGNKNNPVYLNNEDLAEICNWALTRK